METTSSLKKWPHTSQSQYEMKLILQKYSRSSYSNESKIKFKKWCLTLPSFQRVMSRRFSDYDRTTMIDIFAEALNRYINFDARRDVETPGFAKKRKEEIRRNVHRLHQKYGLFSNESSNKESEAFLENKIIGDRPEIRLKKSHKKAARQLFIHVLAIRMNENFCVCTINDIIDLTSILDEVVDTSRVREIVDSLHLSGFHWNNPNFEPSLIGGIIFRPNSESMSSMLEILAAVQKGIIRFPKNKH